METLPVWEKIEQTLVGLRRQRTALKKQQAAAKERSAAALGEDELRA